MIDKTEHNLDRILAKRHVDSTMREVRARRKEVLAEMKAEQAAIEARLRDWLAAVEEKLIAGERPDFAAAPTAEGFMWDPPLSFGRRRHAVKESQTS